MRCVGFLIAGEVVHHGESPRDTEEENEGGNENKWCRVCGAEYQAHDGHDDGGAGQRSVEPAFLTPDPQAGRHQQCALWPVFDYGA